VSITVDDGQATLAKRSGVKCLPLVVLETFSDRDAATVEDQYHWTRGQNLKFKWNGVDSLHFQPRILRISPITRMFEHIPNARTFETREVVRITIDATPRAGNYVWNDLQDSNLIGARVQISSLLVESIGAVSDPRHFDLTALGEVQTKRWAGELTRVEAFDDEEQTITLVFETEEVSLTTLRRLTGFPRAHVEDVGKLMPLVIGTVNEVKPLRFDSGGSNSLLIAINSSVMTIDVLQDTTPRPFGGILAVYMIKIDDELIGCTSVVDQGDNVWRYTVNPTSSLGRGYGVSSPASHVLGAPVSEVLQNVSFLLSGQAIYDIGPRVQFKASGSAEFETLEFGDAQIVKRGNLFSADLGGPIGVLTIDNWAAVATGVPVVHQAGQEMLVDVVGAYEVGSSPTTLIDLDGDDANWAGEDLFGGSEGTVSAITGGVRYTKLNTSRENWFVRAFSPGEVIGDVELTLTLSITQAHLNTLTLLVFFTNVETTHRIYTETMYIQPADLVAGENTIRVSLLADTVDNFGFKLVTIADGTEAIDITGLVETYPITSLSTHPIDVLDYVVDDLAATAQFSNDATTFATAKTNTPSVAINADIAASANTFAALLADIGFNSRINFIFTESQASPSVTTLKAFAADTSSAFAAASRSIGATFRSLIATPRILTELANRFSAIFDKGVGWSSSSATAYRKSLTADEVNNPLSTKAATSLITASQTDYGIRPSEVVPFDLLADEASVIEVFGYYVRDVLNTKAVSYSCVVPFSIGYDLEPGDIVDILPRWKSSAVKVRVTGTTFDFDVQAVGLNLQEVL